MENQKKNFAIGDLIIFDNGYSQKLGCIKEMSNDGYFINYHTGDTAANTKASDIVLFDKDIHNDLENEYAKEYLITLSVKRELLKEYNNGEIWMDNDKDIQEKDEHLLFTFVHEYSEIIFDNETFDTLYGMSKVNDDEFIIKLIDGNNPFNWIIKKIKIN